MAGYFDDFGSFLNNGPLGNDSAPQPNVSDGLGFNPQQGGPFGQDAYRDPSKAFQARGQVQTAQGFDPAQYQQNRGNMEGLRALLTAQGNGQGPSLAGETARQQGDMLAAQGRGLLANQRGANPGLAGYLAAQQGAQAGQQAAGNAMLGRVQEQLGARQQLGALLGQEQQGDLTFGQSQQQNNQFNAGQYNSLLGQDTTQQNQFGFQQNQQIGQMENQRQGKNLDLRNQMLQALLGGAGGAASGGAGGLTQMLPLLMAA